MKDKMLWHTGICALIFMSVFSLFTVVLIITPALAQEENENLFKVLPGSFTVHDAPARGKPYTIPQKLVVWNLDNIERLVFITTVIPPENAVKENENYGPIPNENWVIPHSSSIFVPANSYAEVEISLDIPRWENLTSQRWEVWITFERQPQLGETITLELAVRMRIEIAEELPPEEDESTTRLALLAAGVIIAAAAGGAGAWAWSKRKGRRTPGKPATSRSRR